jgi:hypothetical protein
MRIHNPVNNFFLLHAQGGKSGGMMNDGGAMSPMSGMQSMMPGGGGGAPDAMAGMNRMAGGGGMNGMMMPSGMGGMMHGGHPGMQVQFLDSAQRRSSKKILLLEDNRKISVCKLRDIGIYRNQCCESASL